MSTPHRAADDEMVLVKWPALSAASEEATVRTPRGDFAGLKIICTTSGKHIGLLWTEPSRIGWLWRAAEGRGYGTSASRHHAVERLRDIWNIGHGVKPEPVRVNTTFASPWRKTVYGKGKGGHKGGLQGAAEQIAQRAAPSLVDAPQDQTQAAQTPPPVVVAAPPPLPKIQWTGTDSHAGLTETMEKLLKKQKDGGNL